MIISYGHVIVNRFSKIFFLLLQALFRPFPLYEQEKVLYNVCTYMLGVYALNCLKCGKETSEQNVFCNHCLEVMAQYPVKPGTAIVLPHREAEVAEKKPPRRREASIKEQLQSHKTTIRWLLVTLCALLVALLFVSGMLLRVLQEQDPSQEIGRNYTTTTNSTQP